MKVETAVWMFEDRLSRLFDEAISHASVKDWQFALAVTNAAYFWVLYASDNLVVVNEGSDTSSGVNVGGDTSSGVGGDTTSGSGGHHHHTTDDKRAESAFRSMLPSLTLQSLFTQCVLLPIMATLCAYVLGLLVRKLKSVPMLSNIFGKSRSATYRHGADGLL